eukprot:TRINITY_DN2200_c1_g2_i1.p1 TRINITY_DN2200_c1_g2~~TRINITY_DN2200_c1_g2_i1.p1  ORF type:complete len:280 (-),score=26.11 TRINITY_DN2200_c1_g2_i1:290-1129(-)
MDSSSLSEAAVCRSEHGAATWQAVVDATNCTALLEVADYLDTKHVAIWQAANVETKIAFDSCYEFGTVWQNCAMSQFPQFLADEELYEGKHRQRLLRCHSMILRANYAPGSMLMINTIEEVSSIESQLRNASAFCQAYHSASGREAHLLLGNFQLMKSATGTRFEFGSEGTPFIAGLPMGVLKMIMFMEGNTLVTHTEYAESAGGFPFKSCIQAKNIQLTANVWSCDPGFDLCYENVPLFLDGVRRASSAGQWTNRNVPVDSDNRLTLPVLCVLALMES